MLGMPFYRRVLADTPKIVPMSIMTPTLEPNPMNCEQAVDAQHLMYVHRQTIDKQPEKLKMIHDVCIRFRATYADRFGCSHGGIGVTLR